MASCRKASQAVGNSTLKARTKRLWKEYFRDPSQWWDNRKSKANPRAPDFRHRVTKESLWMDGWHNPSWVQDLLKLEKAEEPKTQEELNRKNNRWEMLSLEEALPSLEEGLPPPPSDEDLACILHKCRKERNLAHALRFCAFMHKSGLDAHRSLGNGLVSMLVEVGSMCHAQQVFDRLGHRDECSWNSLIIGYVRCGEPQHALMLYQKMQENDDSLCPSGHTYMALLKACAKLKDLQRGSEIHAEIARKGLLERDAFVNSSLVDMYAKCGSLAKAHGVFDKLPVRDVVSWTALIAGYTEHGCAEEALNYYKQMQQEGISPDYVTFVCILKACGILGATEKGRKIAQEVLDKVPIQDVILWNALIAGYAEHGHGEEALNCYKQMEQEGISPDAVTFVCMLKACGSIGDIDKGRELHVEISRKGWERDLFVGSTLVDMYAKCGSLAEAQDVFDKLPVRKVVSWNALMAGYAEHGGGEEAINCFRRMQLEDISPDAVTFACCLKACGSTRDIDKGRGIHAEISREGLEIDLFVGSTLIDMYAKCGLLAKAHEVFDKLPVRDVVCWNALITGYVEHGHGEEALNCFEQMQHEGISPHAVMFVCILKACGSIGAADKGHEIHSEISRKGLERDLVVGSTLVDMYSKCGLLATAQEVFNKLPAQDVVSWNALITGYTNYGCGKEALDCFEQMQRKGVCPDDFTFACILKACGSIGATDKSQEIHAEITRKGLERGLFVGSTLVDMYAKCGLPAEAHEAFVKLPVRDVVSWTALMAGYALQLGESQNVIHVFDRMIREGIEPNQVTFVSVLNACSHAGLVDKGQMYFEAISNAYSFIPTLEHYTCIVDLLCRAGHIDKAVAMIKKMPFHPGSVVWHTVLGACRKWGNVELGRHAFEHAVRLDEKNAAAYVCMSNIYADAAVHEDTENVEAMSMENGA